MSIFLWCCCYCCYNLRLDRHFAHHFSLSSSFLFLSNDPQPRLLSRWCGQTPAAAIHYTVILSLSKKMLLVLYFLHNPITTKHLSPLLLSRLTQFVSIKVCGMLLRGSCWMNLAFLLKMSLSTSLFLWGVCCTKPRPMENGESTNVSSCIFN